MNTIIKNTIAAFGAVLIAGAAHGAPRDIQINSVDFTAGVVELHNFGAGSETLTGWRFCTHDEDQVRRYSASTGLNAVTIPAGTSFFIHFNNDAAEANEINISTIGGAFALPLDSGAFGIGLYINSGFGTGSNIADHIQWSIDGIDNTSADERSDEAVTGLVWNSETAWVSTAADTRRIELNNPTAGGAAGSSNINSPADYGVVNPGPRDIQFRTIDLANAVVEVHNYGNVSQPLDGWRFCSHDEDSSLRYSASAGLNGVSIAPGASLFVHFNNDAINADEINISTIGGNFAAPLDAGAPGDAFAIGLYVNSGFGNGNNIADHIQFSFGGADNFTADERSDEAVTGLVWNDEVAWISTAGDSVAIDLISPSAGGVAGSNNVNSPADYQVVAGPSGCDGDANGDSGVDVNDISFVLFRLGDSGAPCIDGDANGDGVVDVNDLSYVLFRLGTCNAGGPC